MHAIKDTLSELNPFKKIILLCCIAVISAMVFLLAGAVLTAFIYGKEIFFDADMLSHLDRGDIVSELKLLQLFQHTGLFLVPPVVFALFISGTPRKYLAMDKIPRLIFFVATGALMFAAMPLINRLVEMNSALRLPEFMGGVENWMKEKEEAAAKVTGAFIKADTVWGFLFNLTGIAIIPALGEEFLFRGVIQRLFSEWTKSAHWGIVIAAFIFSALHFQFYGFLPRMLLGVLFGYLLLWSGSIWLPVFGHFVNNSSAVLFAYLYGTGSEHAPFDPEKFGTAEKDNVYILSSAIIISALAFYIFKNRLGKRPIQGATGQ